MSDLEKNIPTPKIELNNKNKDPDFIQLTIKIFECFTNPSKLIETVKDSLKNVHKLKNTFDEDLMKLEIETEELISVGERLRSMARNNWQNIEHCASDEEYLLQEIKIANELEKKISPKKQIGE